MGDPRTLKRKYETPRKLWDADRIKKEGGLRTAYGMRNAKEIWGAMQELKKARRNAIKLLGLGAEGQEKAKPLLARLARLGVLPADAELDGVLSITLENFLERRLQTRVVKKGMARTMRQARQLVTHGFIGIKGRRVTIPSYMVTADEDQHISLMKPIDITIHEPVKGGKEPAKEEAKPAEEKPAETPSA